MFAISKNYIKKEFPIKKKDATFVCNKKCSEHHHKVVLTLALTEFIQFIT